MELVPAVDPVFVAYIAAFAVAAVGCFASVGRVTRIEDTDTRRGLVALLVTSGGWALAHVGFLLAPTEPLKQGFYLVGLVVGFATVGPWLYFCSAYTNRSLHRDVSLRRVAVGVFLAIVAVKLTNPVHGLYFSATPTATPFPHLAVTHEPLHWIVMGLSYALAIVGAFMLFEYFAQVGYDTTPLLALVGATGLPIVFDIVGFATPYLIDITYEPLGVAVFAVGVAFVYLDRFRSVQLAGSHDDPIIVVDDADRIRDYNDRAGDRFPELRGDVLGDPLWTIVPDVTDALDSGEGIVERASDDGVRYYQVSESPFAAGQATLGRLIVFTDITERERYRRELERQNERLDRFAGMVSHDLRNPLNVAMSRLELARNSRDDENLRTASQALDRMETMIRDVLALARHGQPIDETESVTLSGLARQSWRMVDAGEATLQVDGDLTFTADATRLQHLLENLFRNSLEHGGEDVTIRVGALADGTGFFVEDDGPGIPAEERESVFESGYSTADDGTGFGLAIVDEVVDAHDWERTLTESEAGGVRIEITGV
ncbi:histidine kinase [Halorientalis sp. IM1011]|uniref:sensor histidine kinase n=1 Tax=Halorientalis sp. IM1011 TaxID=1932360 RepID=UPI00097CD6E7|nr:ATP-binding protein [Halorientalis sp. IM1011]AQL43566.1 histidine kinase [Halorientalis sp. IM1011]